MSQWSRICALSDIPPLGARTVRTAATTIAVFRTADDRIFALRDRCPHKGGPLSQGIVHGEQVTCPLHGWVIGLRDGAAEAPDIGCAGRYGVRVMDGDVWLDLTPDPPPSLAVPERYLESSQIQLTSHVLPPSGENDCSIRAEAGDTSDHT